MVSFIRSNENPILLPNPDNQWEKKAVFNGCPVKEKKTFHLLYRAMSSPINHRGIEMNLSTIGHAESDDGVHFENRQQLIKPEYEWELFGCEDPRVAKINGKYYIFYTALSTYPFSPAGIKLGVAVTGDFKTIEEKHQVTTFNSKAMILFPEKINGKLAAILTVHTDMPPAKIAVAYFDNESDIWSKDYWQKWYSSLESHVIHLLRSPTDHLEVGAQPLRTENGWLFIYSYIKNYLSSKKQFGIQAVLLDLENPLKVIGRTDNPLLVPEEVYELKGNVPNIVFPSGAILENDKLFLYYGAADTSCCLAVGDLPSLLEDLETEKKVETTISLSQQEIAPWKLKRFKGNPIITPIPEHQWESLATFNPAVFYDGKKVHIIYRAMSSDYTSVLGYASSSDGFNIDERLPEPIYVPRKDFEKKAHPGNSGCEDPRITKIGDRLYMCYTAFNAKDEPQVALTSIKFNDFVNKDWNWEEPIIVSLPGKADKNSCILEEKVRGRFCIFHRMYHNIWVDFLEDLEFHGERRLMGTDWIKMNKNGWDSEKIGIGAPPIKTNDGWLLIYHGLSEVDKRYRLGAILLDRDDPTNVLAKLDEPILEPDAQYENDGLRPGTVFACGAAIIKNQLFVYYGGADQIVGVASTDVTELLKKIKS